MAVDAAACVLGTRGATVLAGTVHADVVAARTARARGGRLGALPTAG